MILYDHCKPPPTCPPPARPSLNSSEISAIFSKLGIEEIIGDHKRDREKGSARTLVVSLPGSARLERCLRVRPGYSTRWVWDSGWGQCWIGVGELGSKLFSVEQLCVYMEACWTGLKTDVKQIY